jgi:hypothetical protein
MFTREEMTSNWTLTGMSFNTILRDFAGIVTRNRLRRSGAVVVGSAGATARAASNSSPID